MWLGGTRALWELGDGNGAAPLFYRYGAAAKTPQTRSKGFFWAGHAAALGGNAGRGARAITRWPRSIPSTSTACSRSSGSAAPVPALAAAPAAQPTPEQRAAFLRQPAGPGARACSRAAATRWQTKRKFYIAARQPGAHRGRDGAGRRAARDLNLPELAVVVGRVAPEKGFAALHPGRLPDVADPARGRLDLVHAIARQESEFDDYRISHAGAQGLMQLMPGTAREQAGKLGVAYLSAS